MRVGMIVHAYYLKDARVRRYAELLASRGHKVDILCLREDGEPKTAQHLGVDIHRIDIARVRSGRLNYVLEYLASFLRFFFLINRLTWREGRYDLLHVHSMPDFLVFCALFQRFGGTKILLDVHDLMPEVYQSKYFLRPDHWLPRLLRLEEKVAAWFASALITANHAFADILAERSVPTDKVTVVMNAANDTFFLSDAQRKASRAHKPKGDFHVIYIGTLAPRYGVENAVQAIAKLEQGGRIPGLRFSIIPKISNEGEYVGRILADIERAGLCNRFTLMEPVPHDRMPGVISEADALIYTPVPDIHMDIALSLKIPEAIAVGLPVVASALSVNMRYFGKDALFAFEPGNNDECAAQLLEVYENPIKTAEKIAKAREKLAEIGWDKQAKAYTDLVERLCAKPV